MKNKKTLFSTFVAAIFLSGLVFLMPISVKADYTATVSYSCPSGGILSGSMCNKTSNYDATMVCPSGWEFRPDFDLGTAGRADICAGPMIDGGWDLCITAVTSLAYSTYGGDGTQADCRYWGGYYNCNSGDTASADKKTCTKTTSYSATPAYSCPSGGTLSGTTCITDNGCAASTCTGQTCWNNVSWVSGTKDCTIPPNGCETNTCTGQTCWNNVAWVAGTKNCTPLINGECNSSVNNGAYTVADFNLMKFVADPDSNGTINNADALAALNAVVGNPSICTLQTCDLDKNGVISIPDALSILKMSEGNTPSVFCTSGVQTNLVGNGPWDWTCLGSGGGSNALNCHANVKTDNGCADNTCAPGSNGGLPTTCDNGINPFAPGKKLPNFADHCTSTPVTCTADDCGKSIPSATVSCLRLDSSGCMNPTACLGTCAEPNPQMCQACPLKIQSWREVSP